MERGNQLLKGQLRPLTKGKRVEAHNHPGVRLCTSRPRWLLKDLDCECSYKAQSLWDPSCRGCNQHHIMLPAVVKLCCGISYPHLRKMAGLQRPAISAIGQEIAHRQRSGQIHLPAWVSHMGWQTSAPQPRHTENTKREASKPTPLEEEELLCIRQGQEALTKALDILEDQNGWKTELTEKGFVRAEDGPTCIVIEPLADHVGRSRFTWLLNMDVKGWLPKSIVNQALPRAQVDFTRHLRRRLAEGHATLR
ncbi:hypothetical protein DPEC_G00031150 [Dallia pectoralis]|uniref:Uncharacterized protein n=1 Tax=Dallia pectoralis TaxID=75939 RepID=A0ACC2HC42_DALPE|nr:hypothetical protein DPEC_G00031150 [Dallia pectoralis]